MPKEDDTPPTNIGEPSPFKATTPRLKLSVSKPKIPRWQLNLSSPRKSFADMAEFAEDHEVHTGLFDNLSEDEEEPPASKKPKLAGGTWIQPEFQADQ